MEWTDKISKVLKVKMHQAEDRLSGCKDKDLDKGPRQNKQRV